MYSSRRKGLIGIRKLGRCICDLYFPYDKCPFKLTADGKWNTLTSRTCCQQTMVWGMKNDGVLWGVRDYYHLPHRYAQVLAQTKHQQIQESAQRGGS